MYNQTTMEEGEQQHAPDPPRVSDEHVGREASEQEKEQLETAQSEPEPQTEPQQAQLEQQPQSGSLPQSQPQEEPKAPQEPPRPAKRRPLPPKKGILKPPPPPSKPTLGHRLRDMVGGAVTAVGTRVAGGEEDEAVVSGNGTGRTGKDANGQGTGSESTSTQQMSAHGQGQQPSVPMPTPRVLGGQGGTLASLSGRLAMGIGRFVANAQNQVQVQSQGQGQEGGHGPGRARQLFSTSMPPPPSPPPSQGDSLSNTQGPTLPKKDAPPLPPRDSAASPTPKSVSSTPTTNHQNDSHGSKKKQPLKKVTFLLPSISIVYPISSNGEPWSEKVLADRAKIENTQRSLLRTSLHPSYWTPHRLVVLYEQACRGRDERPRIGVIRALESLPAISKSASPSPERIIHLILRPVNHATISSSLPPGIHSLEVPLNHHSAEPVADVLATRFGLVGLLLEDGVVEEGALKSVLHALLVSGGGSDKEPTGGKERGADGVERLSLKGCKKIREKGWNLVAEYLKMAKNLKHLDLSETAWDRKSMEVLVKALNEPCYASVSQSSSSLSISASASASKGGQKSEGTSGTSSSPTDTERGKIKAVPAPNGKLNEGERDEAEWDGEGGNRNLYSPFLPPAPLLKPSSSTDTFSPVHTQQSQQQQHLHSSTPLPQSQSHEAQTQTQPLPQVQPRSQQQTSLQTLRLDSCSLRPPLLEVLAHGIRTSGVKHLSLRGNRINRDGAVGVAVMIRDYDYESFSSRLAGLGRSGAANGGGGSAVGGVGGLGGKEREGEGEVPHITGSRGVTSMTVPKGYTPARMSVMERLQMPFDASSPLDSHSESNLKSRARAQSDKDTDMQERSRETDDKEREKEKEKSERWVPGPMSRALERSVRALENVQRIGRLQTLDLKANDIRGGVTYIAQVLKRNRTLKILNLSSNSIPPAGLAVLAESLKYNTSLSTLSLSDNPCCTTSSSLASSNSRGVTANTLSVNSEGRDAVVSLRNALAVNTTLKRLFLSSVGMGDEGAIALAEFLGENQGLLHLDLTANPIGPAGVHALYGGLKVNRMIRCLDVSMPAPVAGEKEKEEEEKEREREAMARVMQGVLSICVRNTEEAAAVLAASYNEAYGVSSGAAQGRLTEQEPYGHKNGEASNAATTPSKAQMNAAALKPGVGEVEGSKKGENEHKALSAAAEAEVWAPLKRSDLLRSLKAQSTSSPTSTKSGSTSTAPGVTVLSETERAKIISLPIPALFSLANTSVSLLNQYFSANKHYDDLAKQGKAQNWEGGKEMPTEKYEKVLAKAKMVIERLVEVIPRVVEGAEEESTVGIEELLEANDRLTASIKQGEGFTPLPRVLLPSQIMSLSSATPKNWPGKSQQSKEQGKGSNQLLTPTFRRHAHHVKGGSLEISSPNFSIGDSDDNDSDAEELDMMQLAARHAAQSRSASIQGKASSQGESVGLGLIAKGDGDAGGERKDKVEENVDCGLGKGMKEEDEKQKQIERGLMEAQSFSFSLPSFSSVGILDTNISSASSNLNGKNNPLSPVEKTSKAWVEEESEIFRKGVQLGVADEDEDEDDDGERGQEGVSGEELRKEILETPVARSKAKRVIPVESEGGEEREEDEEDDGDSNEEEQRGD
ncbi:hypothetical protein I311_06588 [Cryptococcus gattii NT-10]|nr:hypothetical protein I311_06588 [Cryptococcus gattii NT-10]